ncbi:TonB-dependent siderophore receptor [Phyllobacterium leguminum]|uniref:TonB-dependent siderophore receptor n=1 Tax=Phyllobacterium leguminum TaxID=314237 RepID=UPI001FE21A43|nr:TonB-dependent siderophore receptor [Phyllobacterium leguminum]
MTGAIGATLARLNVALLATAAIYPAMANAQTAQQATTNRVSYAIPATSLGNAIAQFGERSNLQVLYPADLARGRNSRGVSGSLTREQALGKLLSGTGLSYRFTNAKTVTLIETTGATTGDTGAAAEGAIVLNPITIDSRIESAWGPVKGYVAKQGSTGMKTDTPLIETPQSVSVVTRDQMDTMNMDSLNSVLRYTPGVNGNVYGTDNRGMGVQLRGLSSAHGVFYRDGLKLKESQYVFFTGLDPFGAERYEILRGPASVLYGQTGPGGIINYVSKRPTEERINDVSFSVGNFNRKEGRFDFSGQASPESDLYYRLVGLVRKGDTQIDYVNEDRVFIAPSVTWKPDEDTKLTVLSNYQRDRSGWAMQYLPADGTIRPSPHGFGKLPSSRFVGEPGFDTYNNTQASIGYEFEHRFNETWQIKQNARYVWMKHDEEGVFGGGLQEDGRTYDRYADAGGSRLHGVTIDTQALADFETGALEHKFLMGLDYSRYKYRDFAAEGTAEPLDIWNPVYGSPIGELTPYQNTTTIQEQIGLYAQNQITLDKWHLTLGGRQDWVNSEVSDPIADQHIEQKDKAFTGRAGLVYLADNGLAPYISYSESFLPEAGFDSAGNPFEPETGRQYEVGVKYQPVGWNSFITLSAFELTRQNVMRSAGDEVFQTGEITSRGIELEGVASVASGVDLRLAYTYLDTEISKATTVNEDGSSNQGNTPFGVPTHSASLWANYKVQSGALEGLGLGAGVRYVGSTYGDDANTFKVPAVTLVDASVSYDWKNVQLQLGASNLFDKTYVASCFAESFGCFYGEGRRVTGTLKVSW